MANGGIEKGDLAPDFVISSEGAEPLRLSSFRDKSPVVLFFYPKDNSPACTAEACAFRDLYEDFREAGAEVIGISADSSESHDNFIAKRKLPYRLVSDTDESLRKLYGVPKTLGLIAGRVTYVIDRQGIVAHKFNSQFQPWKHAAEALAAIK
jgi:peroxiredoxin Q/BCP